MTEFIKTLIGNDVLATFIMSFIPLVELKGGIVFARGAGIDFLPALLFAFIGSTVAAVPVYFLLKPILKLLKKIKGVGIVAQKAENYFAATAAKTLEKRKNKTKSAEKAELNLKMLGVFIFVAIPLPMTGVWMGTAIAVFLNLKFKDAILPIAVGNLIAGLIISIIAAVCLAVWNIGVLDYILWGLFALAVILLAVTLIKISLTKNDKTASGKIATCDGQEKNGEGKKE